MTGTEKFHDLLSEVGDQQRKPGAVPVREQEQTSAPA